MFDGRVIRKKRKELKLSAPQLAELLQVNLQNLYKWEKGTKPSDPEDYIKIENWLSGKLEIVPNHTNHEPVKPAVATVPGEINTQQLIEAIITLTRNNEKVIDTNATVAETNRVLANRLVAIEQSPTAGDGEQTLKETVYTVIGYREYIIDLAAHLTKKSKKKILEDLDNKVREAKMDYESKHNHSEAGK